MSEFGEFPEPVQEVLAGVTDLLPVAEWAGWSPEFATWVGFDPELRHYARSDFRGNVTVHPVGAWNDSKEVPNGIESVRLTLAASLGPALVSERVYVTKVP